jgi:hypothetical protein
MQQVVDLARQLSAGARSQYEVVERVEDYLTKGGRFQYSTDVNHTIGFPLVEFLLDSRTGYCQHFAGAAALLLRLSGVPTRVVAGFATGKTEDGLYKVRDTDAHAWIEVYFQDIGWVPFDPTPAADAEVAPEVDPLSPPPAGNPGGMAMAGPSIALSVILALAVGIVFRRRSRGSRGHGGELLERLVLRSGGQVTPATTLGDLSGQLGRIGPHVARIAADAELSRYGPGPPPERSRRRVVRALVADVGTLKALVFLVTSAFHRVGGDAGSDRGRRRGGA